MGLIKHFFFFLSWRIMIWMARPMWIAFTYQNWRLNLSCVVRSLCVSYNLLFNLHVMIFTASCRCCQGELPMASMYIESGIWNVLWHRVAQMLQANESGDVLHNVDAVEMAAPDWALLSLRGLLAVLSLAVSVFTKVVGSEITQGTHFLDRFIGTVFDLISGQPV